MNNPNYFTITMSFALAALVFMFATVLFRSSAVTRKYYFRTTLTFFSASLVSLALYILDDF